MCLREIERRPNGLPESGTPVVADATGGPEKGGQCTMGAPHLSGGW